MTTAEHTNHRRSALLKATVAAVLLLAAAGTLLFFHRMFPPKILEMTQQFEPQYDSRPMQVAINDNAVGEEQSRILAFGSRFMGQPGVYALEQTIRERYESAGLDVYQQDNFCAVPRTRQRDILGQDGKPLVDVAVYPLMPNNLQPMNTPAAGLTGPLVLIDESVLDTRQSFAGCIGLIDARDGRLPGKLGFMWSRYAKLGLRALIVAHPDGLGSMPWERIAGGAECMVSTLPINYVRLAATPKIFAHIGEVITLNVRTEYAETRDTTLVGIMRAPHSDGTAALILSCDYDACSPLPDLAPGGMQALSPALHLRLLEGLRAYRDQLKRDVIFISFGGQAMGHDGKRNLLRIIGANQGAQSGSSNPVLRALGRDKASSDQGDVESAMKHTNVAHTRENEQVLQRLTAIGKVLDADGMLVTPEGTTKALAALSADAKALFDEQILYVLNALILELSEPALQAKITFEKLTAGTVDSQEFLSYQTAKNEYEQAMAVAGFNLEQIVAGKQDFLARYKVIERFHGRFQELQSYHESELKKLGQDRALIDLLGRYREKVFVHPYLAPGLEENASAKEEFSFLTGATGDTQPKTFNELCVWAAQRIGFDDGQLTVAPYDQDSDRNNWPHIHGSPSQFVGAFGSSAGYSFYAPINRNRGQSYLHYAYPATLPFMTNTASLHHSLQEMGEVVLALSMGNAAGKFTGRPARMGNDSAGVNFGGRVLVSNVGQSMVPNFPLKGAVLSGARRPNYPLNPGFCTNPFYFTDPYGRYDQPYHLFGFGSGGGYSPLAVSYGEDGIINFIKDEGPTGQRLFKSAGINTWVTEIMRNVTIVTFRAAPVTLLDLLNPQTMREYSGVELVDRHGLGAMPKLCRFPSSGVQEGIQTTFIPPEQYFYVKLLSGTADNEFANEIRGFMLNVDDEFVPDPDREIDGKGYLAQDHALICNVAADTALSMAFLNSKRLEMLKHHNMVDERTEAYNEKSLALSAQSETGKLPQAVASRKARESITYSALNHPVLRESIFEAVLGILWYLGLLVPFVFFFEKLVFGFADIRKQLVAQGAAFLLVFWALSFLHPAFQMVRSSLMILLGFLMILVSGGITVLLSGKFQENLEELRKRSGKIKAADVNAMSAISSAFMLGLNNMHRRKLRTGLTCATLVLMTFVMICFTSVQSDLVDQQMTLGKAMYQGLLLKRDRFQSMTSGEVYALDERYGHDFDICPRTFLIGSMDWESNYENPSIKIVYENRQGVTKSAEAKSVLTFNDRDPVRDLLRFKSQKIWFTEDECVSPEGLPPVMISDGMAENLGIHTEDVDAGTAHVLIQSQAYPVKAIFEAESLEGIQDLDGQDLLPFDIDALDEVNVDRSLGQVVADKDAPRIPARDIIILPADQDPDSLLGPFSRKIIASTVVAMPNLPFPEAREVIDAYMEQSARSVHYGLDGVAYLGKRVRESSMIGLIDMVIPLIIAALVVLNTIRGSVYERREEIYVYNAVGIAPRYVFFMFFAEAIVYAVVGAVLGYILSQGVGRFLTAIDFTGGMNMTFTSLTTIYASLAISGATFISTYFPARTAMEIATPAEDAGWQLPEPDGDVLTFDLPFTFTHRDRIAVLSFFHRYLADHGEGSSGRFFAGLPEIGLSESRDALADQAYIPQITITVWLKPFDLSVSQKMVISMPTDSETSEYKAHVKLTRLSGTRESWMRLNQGFVALVRRHFLHWRAVSERDRLEMYDEGRQLMDQATGFKRDDNGLQVKG